LLAVRGVPALEGKTRSSEVQLPLAELMILSCSIL
jgi:hypothetical protein